MRVDRVCGHGHDSTVQLGEVINSVGEGEDALGVDKVHGVEDDADILLALVVLQSDVADVPIDHGVSGKVRRWARTLKERHCSLVLSGD